MTRPFDPDGAFVGGGIYGLPHSPDEAEVVLIPVPWEATVSYNPGTASAPEAIRRASLQLDLLDRETGRPYERGIALLPIPEDIRRMNAKARSLAGPVIEAGGPGDDPALREKAARVNDLGEALNAWVYETAREWLARDKLVGVVGGDHSAPFGLIRAVAERHPGMGILHLDAHADLREAYEGFTWSHASIMRNVVARIPNLPRLVQVGVRDYSNGENLLIEESGGRIRTFFDPDLRARLHSGTPWNELVREIVETLPDEVYLSFDIDGLERSLCPHTGTPVPGGLSFAEVSLLLRGVVLGGRRIVGLDLCEVAPDPTGRTEWDANVGARLLYKMIGFALLTRPVVL
jgi:agmatinase